MEVVNTTNENIEIFSKVLKDSATWFNSINQPIWRYEDITSKVVYRVFIDNKNQIRYEKFLNL